jgi:ferric-dicitrate binding protein FerR (iron transport regulator)
MENYIDHKDIDWSLLAKYFTKEANDEEIKEVEAWLASSEQNKARMREIHTSWQLSSGNKIDEKAAWKNVKEQLQNKKKKSFTFNPWLYKIAAGLLILIVATYAINKYKIRHQEWVTVTSKDGQTRISLEDGSIIHLNSNTILKYPRQFSGDKREVFIEGEAFLEVSKRDSLPFIVSTSDLKVRVLGTSFNVDAYPDDHTTTVAVASGRVLVASNDEENVKPPMLLEKGEIGVLVFEKDSLFKANLANDNYLAWKTRLLEFDNSKLEDVIKTLNKVYNTNILIDNELLGMCLLTAKFNNKSEDEIIDILANTYDLKIERTSTGLKLYGKGCN